MTEPTSRDRSMAIDAHFDSVLMESRGRCERIAQAIAAAREEGRVEGRQQARNSCSAGPGCILRRSDIGTAMETELTADALAAAREEGRQEILPALRQLYHEVIEAGFEHARDYNWPKAIADAKVILCP